jgi:hypothetical protein
MESRERSGKPFTNGPYTLDELRERLRAIEPRAAADEAAEEAARQAREDDIILTWLYDMDNADRFIDRIDAAGFAIIEMEKLTAEELAKYDWTLDEVRQRLKEERIDYEGWKASPSGREALREARERAESRAAARAEREELEALFSGRSDDDEEDEDEEW